MNKEMIIAYTDGACSGNPGPGGYGVLLKKGAETEEYWGRESHTTNQRMELLAAVVALENTPPGSEVVLHSDSAYLIRAWRENWLVKWQSNGWLNSKGEAVANQDLWRRLLALAAERQVDWQKVAGHSGDPGNERCDALAKAAIKEEPLAPKEPEERPYLLVLNKDEDTVMYVDAQSGSIAKTIAVDKNPHEVVISPNGQEAFVTCSGGDTLLVFDNAAMTLKKRFTHPDFRFPHGLAITQDGKRLLLASTRSGKFFVFGLPNLEAPRIYSTGQEFVHMVSLTPDERWAYIANIRSDSLTLFNMEEEKVVTHLPVGRGPEGVAVHPDGFVYVANQHDDNLYVLAEGSHEVLHRLNLGRLPIRVMISPDGHYALVPNRESGDLSVIDCSRPWEVKRLRVGVWPGGVIFNDNGEFAYVANNKTNDVSVIDMVTLKEIRRIDVGIHPDGIAFLRRTV